MDGPERPIWFAGDLGDPWVVAIADPLPRDTRRINGLVEAGNAEGPMPRTLVLHCPNLTSADVQALVRLRALCETPPRVVLCVGPHARYADVDRWSRAVDVILPEATADTVILRHATPPALRPARPSGPRSRLTIISGLHDLRVTWSEICRVGGYEVEAVRDWSEAPAGVPALWDVPMLESWSLDLTRVAPTAPVVAMLGFSDRTTVAEARALGVTACLESTCEIADLLGTLDRVTTLPLRAESGHEVPPAPRRKAHSARAHSGPGVAERGPRS